MAKLTFSEKQLIETVFDMRSGYFINFTNTDFKDFMYDIVSYDIYEKYPGLSKAKMFRAFLDDESEQYAGKAIILLINHMRVNSLIDDDKKEKADTLYELGKRFLGKSTESSLPKEKEVTKSEPKVDYKKLNTDLLALEAIMSPQERGYAFEKYLNELFKCFGFDPHASYKTTFDQIDGSFVLEGNTILIEAKYRREPIIKDDLILFSKKIELKSHFARGLFITYSSIHEKAIDYFTDTSARFIVLTVEELFLICQNQTSFADALKSKFRLLDEKGLIYRHFMNL